MRPFITQDSATTLWMAEISTAIPATAPYILVSPCFSRSTAFHC